MAETQLLLTIQLSDTIMNALQQMNPPDHIHGDDNLPMNVALCMTEVPVRHCYPVLACKARGKMSVVCLSICKSMRSHYLAPLMTSQHMGSLENSPSLLYVYLIQGYYSNSLRLITIFSAVFFQPYA